MADEIRLSLSLDVTKNNLSVSFRPDSISPDLAGDPNVAAVQTITTAFANLTINTNVTNGGYCWFRNLSTSTTTSPTIKIASCAATAAGTSFPFAALLGGEFALTRCVSTAFSAISSTASADLQFGILSA